MEYLVGRGWWPLLDAYIPKIQQAGGRLTCPPYEKYGTLRVDVTPEPEEITLLLEELEEKSSHICEFCGEKGVEHTLKNEWVKTLCSACYAQRVGGAPDLDKS